MSFLEESQGETDPVLSVEYLHGESPSTFTCQLSSSKHKLKALMEELNKCIEDEVSTSIGGSKGGRQGRAPPPGGPNSFIFMQFSAKM